jgi:hypothetical protein
VRWRTAQRLSTAGHSMRSFTHLTNCDVHRLEVHEHAASSPHDFDIRPRWLG